MEASLSNCTVVEQRTVSCFLWSEGQKTSEIYSGMLALHNKRISLLSKGVLLFHDKRVRIPQLLPLKQFWGCKLNNLPLSMPKLRMSGAVPLLPPYAFLLCTGTALPLLLLTGLRNFDNYSARREICQFCETWNFKTVFTKASSSTIPIQVHYSRVLHITCFNIILCSVLECHCVTFLL
jgi:hypothetical protein